MVNTHVVHIFNPRHECGDSRKTYLYKNTGAVKPGDFEIRENGGVLLSDSGRKKVLTAWQKKKSDQILHPFLQEKISWGLVPYVQALLLARSLRGDLDDYPPFMWK